LITGFRFVGNAACKSTQAALFRENLVALLSLHVEPY